MHQTFAINVMYEKIAKGGRRVAAVKPANVGTTNNGPNKKNDPRSHLVNNVLGEQGTKQKLLTRDTWKTTKETALCSSYAYNENVSSYAYTFSLFILIRSYKF